MNNNTIVSRARLDDTCIGVIGLGNMGGAIATNLIKYGWNVYGYDIDPSKCKQFAMRYGVPVSSLAELASVCRFILISLPTVQALVDTCSVLGKSLEKGSVVLEISTFAVEDKLAQKEIIEANGAFFIDAPISGTGAQAIVRDLAIYLSGEEAACMAAMPFLRCCTRSQHYMGEFGNGMKMKYVANLLVAIHNVAAAEALLFGANCGLDPQRIYDIMCDSAGASKMLEIRGPMMITEKYQPATMRHDTFQKDLDIIQNAAKYNGSYTPLFNASHRLYNLAMKAGLAKEDTASVHTVMKQYL